MHRCLFISEILHEIFEYSAIPNLSPLAALARTCRLFREPALDILWREVDDVGPLVKCMPEDVWVEEESEEETSRIVTLKLRRNPTQEDWEPLYEHLHRIRRFTFCHQRYTESGIAYRVSWAALAALSQHVSTARRRPGPFLPNLNVLHFDYYERFPALWVADCFSHIAGPSLEEVHLHCDDDFVPDGLRQLNLTVVLPLLTTRSPHLNHVSIWDSRNYPTNRPCNGVSGLLSGLHSLQRFTCSLPIKNTDIASLARQQKLTALSIALFMNPSQGPTLSPAVRVVPVFRSLNTLVLHVAHIDLATAFVGFLETGTLCKLRIATPMWFEDTELQNCFKAVSRHRRLQELSIAIVTSRAPITHGHFGAQCFVKATTMALLFPLEEMLVFSLSAQDHAQFETDLDDASIEAMARAWPRLRSLSLVQGSSCPPRRTLAPARTTMRSLLALRDHCPCLSGLSIGLDTTSFEGPVLHAAVTGGEAGHALRKLNIDARSTPVSNPSIAAQILHGLFPQLHNIHDGSSIAWDEKRTDWQEVGSILRGMMDGMVVDLDDYDFMDEDMEL